MDFYLGEENVCSARTNQSQIAYCLQFSLLAEECVKCELNFTLTTDKKKCLKSIPNCSLYVKSDSSNTLHECDTCINGFYYDMDIT